MKKLFIFTGILVLLSLPSLCKTLFYDFSTGESKGLFSQKIDGDGYWQDAVVDGIKCGVTKYSGNSLFAYFQISEDMPKGMPAFVTIEYYDQVGSISIEYDSTSIAYKQSTDTYNQEDTKKWQRKTFLLYDPSYQKREHVESDFRIYSNVSLYIKRVELSTEKPEDYVMPKDPIEDLDERTSSAIDPRMTAIQQWQIHEPIIPEQLSDLAYERAKKIGITSMQSYVGWKQIEPEQGKLDFTWYDPLVNQLRKHNIKWLPMLIMAPEITVPDWWIEDNAVFATCLEHSMSAPVQSIWNPNIKAGIKRFLEIFREHYEPEIIEALNLGISGCWGESIQIAGGGFGIMDRHQHMGYWCGDPYAKISFDNWLKNKYNKNIIDLNRAWNDNYTNFDEIDCFVPNKNIMTNRKVMDLSDWYLESMTDLSEFWVATARELYPDTKIYLCTGGDGNVMLGADFGDQARRIAPYNAGIRITNQADDVFQNYSLTRMASSATRLYGAYYTTEPGGDNIPDGIAGRVFDATAGGALGAYFKFLMDSPDLPNVRGLKFMDNAKYFIYNEPKLTVAALMPNTSIALSPNKINDFMKQTAFLRQALDYEWLDENMISDDLLNNFKALVIISGDTLEQRTFDKIETWVKNGGVLFVSNNNLPFKNIEGNSIEWVKENKLKASPAVGMAKSEKFSGYAVSIGSDVEYGLDQSWHAAEGIKIVKDLKGIELSYRWTNGDSKIILPVPSGKEVVLKVLGNIPNENISGDVHINGIKVLTITPSKDAKWFEAKVPAEALKEANNAVISFKSKAFIPSDTDPRELGTQIYGVILKDSKINDEKVLILKDDTKSSGLVIDENKLFTGTTNPYGKGYTVVFPEVDDIYLRLIAESIYNENSPWKGTLTVPIDGKFDNIASSIVNDEVFYINNGFNETEKTLLSGKKIKIDPFTIISIPLDQVLPKK